ncbi:hypothetical protein AKJ09_02128 [Labilithrix luteola]|uniref:Uncharacterized protein n=1 Tax=Labilithrix luteola TaxID=1391654 RepID=A0A0K1PQR8_9BACT|nr:hypothetical protein AKJ09_02128 [Labilithrix luteola]
MSLWQTALRSTSEHSLARVARIKRFVARPLPPYDVLSAFAPRSWGRDDSPRPRAADLRLRTGRLALVSSRECSSCLQRHHRLAPPFRAPLA